MEKKILDVTSFWDEVKKSKEEETAIQTVSLRYLSIFRKIEVLPKVLIYKLLKSEKMRLKELNYQTRKSMKITSYNSPILELPNDPLEVSEYNSSLANKTSLSEFNQKLNDKDASNVDIVYNKKIIRDAYLRMRQDLYEYSSQKN
ncbi:16286_t:CDS:2 [Funneliformis mosseae]|uniref:16286_t:CDS:1 n=1 Tax=Funneliformis mosseae TaxID=27381 RepID=A0A9N9EFG4_FUNMO|nr:16286_t:CDS:2 [Funneliformis mosseae]